MTPTCGYILVADEDPAARAFLGRLFSRAGYVTREVDTGEDALSAVRKERPDLVVLDVLLPDISGFEICRILREEFGDALAVIFVSDERVEPLDRAVGMLLGGDDYVIKPFNADELLARVRRAIARSRPDPAATAAPRDLDLTGRELEVLSLLAEGQGSSEIAQQLVISPKTVASHLQRILAKLGVHSRAQAVAVAYQSGLLKDWTREERAALV